jgi:hypothetical protein
MNYLYSLILCALCAVSLHAQTTINPLQCQCSTNATLSSTEAQARRGVPAFIVLRGQRFGGTFGDAVGGENIDIPHFPNQYGSQVFGGGISRRTAQEYGAILGPFKAGVPTVATIIADIVDIFGDVVTTGTSTQASLVVGNIIPEWRRQWLSTESSAVSTSSNGRFEWRDVQIEGLAGTTLTLQVRHASLTQCGCHVQVSLQGGFPFFATFATQAVSLDSSLILYPRAQGPFAVPGVIGGYPSLEQGAKRPLYGYDGSVSAIVVGEKVQFPHRGIGTYPAIALHVEDRFGNAATFSTTVTLQLNGGNPPVDQLLTPVLGNTATSLVTWGQGVRGQEHFRSTSASLAQIASNVAVFHDFTVFGVTSNQCSLTGRTRVSDPYLTNRTFGIPLTFLTGNTSAIVSLMPSRAVAISPVFMQAPFNRNVHRRMFFLRMPSQMVIGKSNSSISQEWFAVEAVDEFGNRVDRGPYAYNGGEARISFYSHQQSLPKSNDGTFQFTQSQDPFVKINTQQYSARGTTARAINGVYLFNNFMPLGPTSREDNDVILTFEDIALKGVRLPFYASTTHPIFSPIPPITTATTTFLAPTSVRLSGQVMEREGRLHISPNPIEASNSEARMQFVLQEASDVRIEILSLHGARVARIHAGFMPSGEQHIPLPIGELPSGVYAVRVLAGTTVQTAMMIVVR